MKKCQTKNRIEHHRQDEVFKLGHNELELIKRQKRGQILSFLTKIEASERFRNQWLKESEHNLKTRHKEKYHVPIAKRERYKNGHANAMRR